MSRTQVEQYAVLLGALHGTEFQAEVAARLHSVTLGLQVVPPYPQGDGGVDALSHNGSRGYCCYGLEPDPAKTARAKASAIVKKFTQDLYRVFELKSIGGKLVHSPNSQLAGILWAGVKLQHIDLISNWFKSHDIIGRLQTAFAACKSASQCNLVDVTATMVIKGPSELANEHAVDEITITRINQRAFVARLQTTVAASPEVLSPSFDGKVQKLRELAGPTSSHLVDTLAEQWRKYWRLALAFEYELDQTVPAHHEALQRARERIANRVTTLRLSPRGPLEYIEPAQGIANEVLSVEFRQIYGSLVDDLAPGETARLVGECSLDWDPPVRPSGN